MVSYDSGDTFISDDDEELCPLCVEEMDLSDKNFKPCPCGYQVCQFCYNNIRQNPQLNGRCPACRRTYDDDSVEYKIISPEEWKKDHEKQARKERERKQRQREKKESEQLSRKHLSGMRVIQKNLVYVIGLNPSIPIEELHNTLRTDQFFGQYGKIQKIVINRRNNANGTQGIGVYVTFARKEDAAKCITAVDGSLNDGKYLRAAYGTTKYCSSYLRGQSCPNPNCMFLHEPGEEADSYTRQDLSTYQVTSNGSSTSGGPSSGSPTESSHTPLAHHNTSSSHTSSSASHKSSHSNNEPHNYHLPPTVSWATKASPSISQAKLHTTSLSSYPPLPLATSSSLDSNKSGNNIVSSRSNLNTTEKPLDKKTETKAEKSQSRSTSPSVIPEAQPVEEEQPSAFVPEPKELEEQYIPDPKQRSPDVAVTYMRKSLEALACPDNFSSFDLSDEIPQNGGVSSSLFSFVKTAFDDESTKEQSIPAEKSKDNDKSDTVSGDDFSDFLFKPSPIAWGFRAQIEIINFPIDNSNKLQAAIAAAQTQAAQQQQAVALQIQQQAFQQQLEQQAALQQQILQHQRQQQHQNAINSFTLDPAKTTTPPPPGLFSQSQQQLGLQQQTQNQSQSQQQQQQQHQQQQQQQQFNSPMVAHNFVQNSGVIASPAIGGAAALQNFQNMQMFQQQPHMGMQQIQPAQSPSQANSGELLARLMGKRDAKGLV